MTTDSRPGTGREHTGTVEVHPAAGHIGADITGVDLAGDLDEGTVAAIRQAVLRWKVVFFRGQRLDHAGHVALARRFGEPVVLPRRGSASPADLPQIETTPHRPVQGGRDRW
ncbi:TauD/TfdA dioxygenase family protein, partial [Streptomyces pseudogriseolus]|uniref:TauD/TfdA dioxygenase family protein n=1 Tax=Streptomyces pseudogriseolus TaxID=36817 RepID=UPI003FA237B7